MSELSRNVCDYWDMSAVPQVSVFGEALIDLIVPEEGEVHAVAGGAPFNTARALGRLGVTTSFIGSVAQDRFGDRLVAQLIADEVDRVHLQPLPLPSFQQTVPPRIGSMSTEPQPASHLRTFLIKTADG